MNINPLVSVIIPTHNRANLLPRSINSVLSQTYKNLECIVVDDGSNDNTHKVVADIKDDRLIFLQHDKNKNASVARNTGIKHAKGDLIAFLDDDDEWLPTKLEKQVPLIQSLTPDVGMVYCWMDYYDKNGKLISEVHPTLRGYIFPNVLDAQRIGGCPTLIVRREVIDLIGGFDESLPRGNDGDFIRRVCRKYEVDFIPEVLVKIYIKHCFKRISDNKEDSIRNIIKSLEIRFIKFEEDLNKYPREFASIYAMIGLRYSQIGEVKRSITNSVKAIMKSPLSGRVYFIILRSIKEIIYFRFI